MSVKNNLRHAIEAAFASGTYTLNGEPLDMGALFDRIVERVRACKDQERED
jgi:hypothetical protein